jgi:hypothetical protein
MEPEDPEGPGLTASCELDALAAARSEEGSGRVRFQYGTNLVCEDEAVGSRGSDADAAGGAEDLKTSLAGLELLVAVSKELPGAERGSGRGRLPLVGEVGEVDRTEEAGWCEGAVAFEPGRERLWGCGEVGTGVGPGVGRGGRKADGVNWDGGAPGVGSGLRERPLETGLVDGEEWTT